MREALESLALDPITDPATAKVALDLLDAADELDFAGLQLEEEALTRPTEGEALRMMTAADIHSGQARLIRGLVADARILPIG